MGSGAEPVVRDAKPADVPAICRFGAAHIPSHYAPLIGAEAADAQVRNWWSEPQISQAVTAGLVVVAEDSGKVVGVAQRGRAGDDHVVYKLYVHPDHRGSGLGPRLLDALIGQLPPDADRLHIEHFAANERAGEFYEREGFTVERVEPSPTQDPALAVVWRARDLPTASRPPR
ncbi:MAG TPA: GNAT family N-acetyltransferase [Actinomycetales bacterium]|nr:GNAT family N-acetyltransferase [Actinomycetales bacterium]